MSPAPFAIQAASTTPESLILTTVRLFALVVVPKFWVFGDQVGVVAEMRDNACETRA